MTSIAADRLVFTFKCKTDRCMVERRGVESYDLKIPPMMFFMAFFAKFAADRCVVALFQFYPRINFSVAEEAFLVGKRFTDCVTCCAIFNALPFCVTADEISRRYLSESKTRRYNRGQKNAKGNLLHRIISIHNAPIAARCTFSCAKIIRVLFIFTRSTYSRTQRQRRCERQESQT